MRPPAVAPPAVAAIGASGTEPQAREGLAGRGQRDPPALRLGRSGGGGGGVENPEEEDDG